MATMGWLIEACYALGRLPILLFLMSNYIKTPAQKTLLTLHYQSFLKAVRLKPGNVLVPFFN